jgi:hypothetical protein
MSEILPFSWPFSHQGQIGEPRLDMGSAGKSSAREEGGMASILALSGSAATVLWIIAAILVIYGIVMLVRGAVMQGVLLIVVGLLVGPGGVSIFK